MVEREGVRRLEGVVDRARRVLQQHVRLASIPVIYHDDGVYPHYAERGEGARFWDVAGTEYLDWYLGGGPLLLGHRHQAVHDAIVDQLDRGIHVSLPTELEVDVAERICDMVPSAEQVIFGKNGSDVTSAAIRLARKATGRDRVLMCGYHGFQDWSIGVESGELGIPAGVRDLVRRFPYNDLERASDLLKAHPDEVAAIIVEPLHYQDLRPEFLQGLRELADRYGCLLIFDEIVSGFRVARGGAQELAGVQPDLTCLAKGLANGMPLSALVGARRHMRHANAIRFGMTYRRDALSLAASKAVLDVVREQDVSGHLVTIGERLQKGFNARAESKGLPWRIIGHPALAHVRLGEGGRLTAEGVQTLFIECCHRKGIYIAPGRLFSSLAHQESDVDRTLEVMDAVMDQVMAAMEHGLEGRMDSPIGPSKQKGPEAEVADSWGGCPLPNPFEGLPDEVGATGLEATWNPDDGRCRVHPVEGGVELTIDHTGPDHPSTCGVGTQSWIDGDYRCSVRYRFTEWLPRNATVTCFLIGECGETWFGVQHDSSFGRHAFSRAFLGGVNLETHCAYGTDRGRLILERSGSLIRAFHETTGAPELIATSEEVPSGPSRFLFRLWIRGASGPVSVLVEDFVLDVSGS